MKKTIYNIFLASVATLLAAGCEQHLPYIPGRYTGWEAYGGTKDAARYSSLDQINTGNVGQLKMAWEYHTRDIDTNNRGQIQCNPIVIDTVLYGLTSRNKLFAIHAATGREIWQFDAFKFYGGANSWAGTGRGLNFWQDGAERRLLFCAGQSLMAIDPRTGQPIPTFGQNGRVDLQRDLDHHKDSFLIVNNTPGVIYKDLLIMGMRLSEGLDAAPGHIRAYDVRTGKRRWIFHTIPHPGEFGYETWSDPEAWKRIGGANSWAGMSLDEKRGLVFAGTGSATYDFWGGYRKGQNLFANCILALDAATGKRRWHYQTVHHDIWDRDLPAPPNLVTILHKGKPRDAVAQITKHGFVFVLDRETGEPLFPIEEVAVPGSTLEGEQAWPTQPHPTLPEPFMRQRFTEQDIINISPEHHKEIADKVLYATTGSMFTPPNTQGLVLFPGFDGGGEWGGASFDPETGWLYVNANEMPWMMRMVQYDVNIVPGQVVYNAQCANCHGADRKGSGAFPSLLAIGQKYQPQQIAGIIRNGKGAMPGFGHLGSQQRADLINFLTGRTSATAPTTAPTDKKEAGDPGSAPLRSPYVMDGYRRFLTHDDYPAIRPPWGTMNAIDLNTGKIVWRKTLGELPELTAKGIPPTGAENYGGPVSTAGGVLFIGATKDEKFRAFDKKTGALLFETALPAGGYATPAVYSVGGKQYVVIACGGGKMGTKSGDSYMAFALP